MLRGAEHADKNRNGNGKNAQRRNDMNTHSDNGEGTTGNTRADSETKKRLMIGSWNVPGMWVRRGRTQKDRNCRTSKKARPRHSGNSRVLGERGGGEIGYKVGECAWIGKKRKGQKGKNRGAGGGGFLVKEPV